ncbi:MAG: flavin reductase [Elusimicrobia bacterium HGW-Elusimicrobia-1]|jgi:flavin reductase (DIM6/NTAB) family NADH-FMN oxidoreductase RutF|nr:MAG: flavin reductase [Elusimicrobia bacterium HGW-Elusimicrobia-1]
MHKEIPKEEFYRLINHGPCVIISSGDDKKANIAPVAWKMPLNDDPPLVAVALSEDGYTAELISATGTFVVNVPDSDLLASLLGAGKVSGRDTDKIKRFGARMANGEKIKTPHLADAVGWIECETRDKRIYEGVALFTAKVLYAAVDDGAYDGYLDPSKRPTVHHLGGGWFAQATKRIKL